MVVVEATTQEDERVIVQRAAEEARQLTSDEAVPSLATNQGGSWDGRGICTYEGLGAAGESVLTLSCFGDHIHGEGERPGFLAVPQAPGRKAR